MQILHGPVRLIQGFKTKVSGPNHVSRFSNLSVSRPLILGLGPKRMVGFSPVSRFTEFHVQP